MHRASAAVIRLARSIAANAMKNGVLVAPAECSKCGRSRGVKIVGHHADYTRPLDVEWLCSGCHFARHREEGTGTAGRARCPACRRLIYRHVQDAGRVREVMGVLLHEWCVE